MFKINLLVFIWIFTLSLFSNAVEYICWQQADFPGMAYEASSNNCDDKRVEKGSSPSNSASADKEIVCVVPAMCLALTPEVVNYLINKTGISSIEDIKKLNNNRLQSALLGSRFSGRVSQITCKGNGKIKNNSYGQSILDEAQCPTVTACANVEDVFYSLSMGPPQMVDTPAAAIGNSISIPKVPSVNK